MDQVDYDAYKQKIDELTMQNKALTRANSNMRKTNKHLQRIINKLKDEAKEKSVKSSKAYYKNGKRGSRFNG
jgi:uncharacterized coiled-coil protein SlyX